MVDLEVLATTAEEVIRVDALEDEDVSGSVGGILARGGPEGGPQQDAGPGIAGQVEDVVRDSPDNRLAGLGHGFVGAGEGMVNPLAPDLPQDVTTVLIVARLARPRTGNETVRT